MPKINRRLLFPKKNEPRPHRRLALLRQAASFTLLVTVLILLFIFASQQFNQIFRQEVQHSNQLFLDIASEAMDEKFQSLETSISFVCSNNKFSSLFIGEKSDITFYRRVSELKDSLSDYNKSTGVECWVYIPDWDYLITPLTASELTSIFRRQQLGGIIDDEQAWRETLSKRESGFFFSTQHNLTDSSLHLIYSKPLYMKRKSVLVYASIPVSELNNAVALSGSALLVSDAQGNVLASLGEDASASGWQHLPAEVQTVEDYNGDLYILTSGASSHNDWRFIIAAPEATYWASYTHVTQLLVFTIAAAALFGLIASVLLLRYNYRPMYNLMRTLRGYGSGEDEYAVITSAFQGMWDENQNYRADISDQHSKLRAQYLLSRLKGRKYVLQNRDFNLYYSIATEGCTWCLAAICAEPLLDSGCTPKSLQESQELVYFALNNVFSELTEAYPHYQLEDGNQLFYLFYLDEKQLEQWQLDMPDILSFVQEFFKEHTNSVLSGVISRYVSDFDQISKLYSEVTSIIEHRTVMGEVGVVFAETYQQQQSWLFHSSDWFQDLEAAVSAGNTERAVALANGAFSRLSSGKDNFSVLKIEVNECMYRIMVVFQAAVSDQGMRQELIDQTMSIAIHTESVSDLRERFAAAVQYACDAVREGLRTQNHPLVKEINAYVEENYSDVNLNVATIAEYFGRHPNYISKIYLAETGIMLLNRIHKVRIQHAKELLRQGGMTIERVAEQTGFNNSRTFRRVFVKETGLNPGEYQAHDATKEK